MKPKPLLCLALLFGSFFNSSAHPQWQTNDLYQDIPINVFTHQQWTEEQQGKMWPDISAGGVIYELWDNRNYVFAMSSRYDAQDDVKGWQEAADIIATNCAAHPGPPLYPAP